MVLASEIKPRTAKRFDELILKARDMKTPWREQATNRSSSATVGCRGHCGSVGRGL